MYRPVLTTVKLAMIVCFVSFLLSANLFAAEAPAASAPQPVAFTKNMGQWPDSILFRASIGEAVMWIVKDGVYYQFTKRIPRDATSAEALAVGFGPRASLHHNDNEEMGIEPDSFIVDMVKAHWVDANPAVEVLGFEALDYKCNYFLGNDPAKWQADVPNYAGISLKSIYPGVDAIFHSENGRLVYDLRGSAKQIAQVRTEYLGALAKAQVDGSVVLETKLGEKHFHGMLPIMSFEPAFAEAPSIGTQSSMSLAYSTYLGGTDREEGFAIAVDGLGCAYITGRTFSSDFPTANSFDGSWNAIADAFVTKLSSSGNSLAYSTYLGGSSVDSGGGIAVDGLGAAYVTGITASSDFPTANSFDSDANGGWDVFVTKLSPSGNSLEYSTYLGGTSYERGRSIAVDGSGSAYITGITTSPDFPTANSFDDSWNGNGNGWSDAFVTKFSSSGDNIIYSTFLGGSHRDEAYGIAVDGSGSAYITGKTRSTNFPTANAYDSLQNGTYDAFVTKLSSFGNSLEYSTYLGGNIDEWGQSIAVGVSGSAYVTGATVS